MKHSIEEIRKEFNDKGLTLLSTEYKNGKTKLDYICQKHLDKGVQHITYDDFKYRNRTCHFCTQERRLKEQRMSVDEAKHLVESKGLEFVDIKYGKELNSNNSILYFICKKHSYAGIQSKTVAQFRNLKYGCPYCTRVCDTFTLVEKLQEVLPYVKILGEYEGQRKKIKCLCMTHNEIFYSEPRKLLQGVSGCKSCRNEKNRNKGLLTHDEFVDKLKTLQPSLQVIGKYIDSTTPIKLYCTEHDCYFEETPNTYLYKHRQTCCPLCNNVLAKTDDQFQSELNKKFEGKIIALDSYRGRENKIRFKCLTHDYIWVASPVNVLKGKGCPKCNCSTGELEIQSFLQRECYQYEWQKRFQECKDQKPLPFDFYLPQYNLIIEYDGEGHYLQSFYDKRCDNPYEAMRLTQKHDQIKNDFCEANNINLLRIPYWEKDNMFQLITNTISDINHANTEVT